VITTHAVAVATRHHFSAAGLTIFSFRAFALPAAAHFPVLTHLPVIGSLLVAAGVLTQLYRQFLVGRGGSFSLCRSSGLRRFSLLLGQRAEARRGKQHRGKDEYAHGIFSVGCDRNNPVSTWLRA
jgi:hypothetical protein